MSYQQRINGDAHTREIVPHQGPEEPIGDLENREVTDAAKGSNKGWYILAIVVGSVFMVGSVSFGTVGLLQSHGLISLPQSFEWLKTAIAAVDTPHSWSLWVMTGSGAVVGVTVIGISSSQIHKIRMAEKEEDRQHKLGMFGDHFETLKVNRQQFSGLQKGFYSPRYFTNKYDQDDKFCNFVVLRNTQGQLLCTNLIDDTTTNNLQTFLQSEGYSEDQTD